MVAGDVHGAARLLTAEQRRRLVLEVGHGPRRVSRGHRELALVCRKSDATECEELAKLGHTPDGIPGLFRLTAEGLSKL